MKRLPAAKRYIVCPEAIQGRKDLNADMRRKTRAGRSSHRKIVIGFKPSLNSNKLHNEINSEITISTENRSGFYKRSQNEIKI